LYLAIFSDSSVKCYALCFPRNNSSKNIILQWDISVDSHYVTFAPKYHKFCERSSKQCRRSSRWSYRLRHRRLLLSVRKLTIALRVAYGLLIRRRTMEISFRGREARAGRNNNLLTSHAHNATRYLASAHAFTSYFPSALSGVRARILSAPLCTGPALRHRIRQPIVSAAIVIYRLNDLRFRLHQRQRRQRISDRFGAS